jgi:hypothetical protein
MRKIDSRLIQDLFNYLASKILIYLYSGFNHREVNRKRQTLGHSGVVTRLKSPYIVQTRIA